MLTELAVSAAIVLGNETTGVSHELEARLLALFPEHPYVPTLIAHFSLPVVVLCLYGMQGFSSRDSSRSKPRPLKSAADPGYNINPGEKRKWEKMRRWLPGRNDPFPFPSGDGESDSEDEDSGHPVEEGKRALPN